MFGERWEALHLFWLSGLKLVRSCDCIDKTYNSYSLSRM